MEKIIISCSAEYLHYEFPKRKWYQIRKHDRIAMMRLAYAGEDILEFDILLHIYEKFLQAAISGRQQDAVLGKGPGQEFFCQIDTVYKAEVYKAFLKHYQISLHRKEHVILLDGGGDILQELVYQLAEDRNYLTILTDTPEKYEHVLKETAMDFGLFAMVFTRRKDFIRYIKQMPQNKQAFVIADEDDTVDSNTMKQAWEGKSKGSLLYHLPKGSFFMDFSENEVYRSIIYQKRMSFTYVSIPIFLDNIVKNRYNSVVNEGITFQVMKAKRNFQP